MFRPKFRFTHDEVRIIVMALVELKNQLISADTATDSHHSADTACWKY